MQEERAKRLGVLALIAGAVGIAFAPIFVRASELAPSATAFYRLLFALPILWLWMTTEQRRHPEKRRPATRRDFAWLALAGLFFTGDLALWHWSIKYTTIANSTLLANFAPIFVTLAAALLFQEAVPKTFIWAMVLSLAGAALLVRASFHLEPARLFGDILALATAVFYAAYQLTVNRLRKIYATGTIMAWVGLSATLALFVVSVLSGESLVAMTAHGWFILIGLAVISHAGGQGMIAYAFGHLSASFGSLGLLLQPVVAAALAWLIFGEALGPLQILGAVVTLAGLYLARKSA